MECPRRRPEVCNEPAAGAGDPVKQLKRSTTDEISALMLPADLAQVVLGDAYDPGSRVELHIEQNGPMGLQRVRIDGLTSIMLVQFTRREHDVPEHAANGHAAAEVVR